MSILDDAIREHLELKRAHGADESEVKKLEDEAFGPTQRPDEPDPFAEAPTEFLTAPGDVRTGDEEPGGRAPNITDLQEPPPPPASKEAEVEEAPAAEEPPSEPSVEQHPAMEHEAIADPGAAPAEPSPPSDAAPAQPPAPAEAETDAPPAPEPTPDGVHTTEEREAIADQPTQMFDVEAELGSGAEAESPSDEELVDAGVSEPRLVSQEPEVEEDEDDFFSEQRLSDELNQALEAPVTDEKPLPGFDEPSREEPLPAPPQETAEQAPPPPRTEEGTAIFDIEEGGEAASEEDEANPYDPETGSHEDVLEDTPEFLEDAPEDENLWFEQRPPKDFDFDD